MFHVKPHATAVFKPSPSVMPLINAAVQQGLTTWAERVYNTSQVLVAVDTGELKESGHVTVEQSGNLTTASVEYDAAHAIFVEMGTGIRGASSPGAGPGPYSPTWPGMPAQPYVRPALDQHQPEAQGIVQDAIKSILS